MSWYLSESSGKQRERKSKRSELKLNTQPKAKQIKRKKNPTNTPRFLLASEWISSTLNIWEILLAKFNAKFGNRATNDIIFFYWWVYSSNGIICQANQSTKFKKRIYNKKDNNKIKQSCVCVLWIWSSCFSFLFPCCCCCLLFFSSKNSKSFILPISFGVFVGWKERKEKKNRVSEHPISHSENIKWIVPTD